MMGGVAIDPHCRTPLEGLFAAGEDAGGVHGANRLGGNGVADSTVFGGIAGDTMAQWVEGRSFPKVSEIRATETVRRLAGPLVAREGEELYAFQAQLRQLMWERVGLIRDGEGLRSAADEIEALAERVWRVGIPGGPAYNLAWQDWLNLLSQLTAARLIRRSALGGRRAEARTTGRTSLSRTRSGS